MVEWLQHFWQGLGGDFHDLPDGTQVGQIVGRTLVAAVLGGVLGYEREQKGKAAGLRTHILVALAAAFFVIIPQHAGMSDADLSRVLQGLAAGVGFLGAGSIIKQSEQGQVLGLTTAAGLYFTTAIGIAAGMGREVTAILGTGLAIFVQTVLLRAEKWIPESTEESQVAPQNTGKDISTPPPQQQPPGADKPADDESPAKERLKGQC